MKTTEDEKPPSRPGFMLVKEPAPRSRAKPYKPSWRWVEVSAPVYREILYDGKYYTSVPEDTRVFGRKHPYWQGTLDFPREKYVLARFEGLDALPKLKRIAFVGGINEIGTMSPMDKIEELILPRNNIDRMENLDALPLAFVEYC